MIGRMRIGWARIAAVAIAAGLIIAIAPLHAFAATTKVRVTDGSTSKSFTRKQLAKLGKVKITVNLKDKNSDPPVYRKHTYRCAKLSAVLKSAKLTGTITHVHVLASDGFTADYTSAAKLYVAYANGDGSALAASEGPFRVVTPGGTGKQNPYWVTTITVTRVVATKTTITRSASSVALGGTLKLSGTCTPAAKTKGGKVVVYVKKPGSPAWVSLSTRAVAAGGAWSYSLTLSASQYQAGTSSWKATLKAATGYKSSKSKVVNVVIK